MNHVSIKSENVITNVKSDSKHGDGAIGEYFGS